MYTNCEITFCCYSPPRSLLLLPSSFFVVTPSPFFAVTPLPVPCCSSPSPFGCYSPIAFWLLLPYPFFAVPPPSPFGCYFPPYVQRVAKIHEIAKPRKMSDEIGKDYLKTRVLYTKIEFIFVMSILITKMNSVFVYNTPIMRKSLPISLVIFCGFVDFYCALQIGREVTLRSGEGNSTKKWEGKSQ